MVEVCRDQELDSCVAFGGTDEKFDRAHHIRNLRAEVATHDEGHLLSRDQLESHFS